MSQPFYDALLALFLFGYLPVLASLTTLLAMLYGEGGIRIKSRHLFVVFLWPVCVPLILIDSLIKNDQ